MGIDVPKECYVVGYEKIDGTLNFYAAVTDPKRFNSYEDALNEANFLNTKVDQGGQAPYAAKTRWQVYRMQFEVVEPVTQAKNEPKHDRIFMNEL